MTPNLRWLFSLLVPSLLTLLALAAHPASAAPPNPDADLPLLTGVQDIVAGAYHTCALTASGGVLCWGANDAGQLGDGTTLSRAAPSYAAGLDSGVKAIAAGGFHTCAVLDSGAVQCWGANSSGQLGDGTATGRLLPVSVEGLGGEASVLAGGYSHTCALTAIGGLQCWGGNGDGALGDGTTTNRRSPADVAGLASGVQLVAAGPYAAHTHAVTQEGGLKAWGRNLWSQLGIDRPDLDYSAVPLDVVALAPGIRSAAAGDEHACAVTSTGAAKCWGNGSGGRLGDGSEEWGSSRPVDVQGLGTGVLSIRAGFEHTCALTTGGVMCWGYNGTGALGDGTTIRRRTPTTTIGLTGEISALTVGAFHTCAVTTDGGVKCWGANGSGQLGDGSAAEMRLAPVDVTAPVPAPQQRLFLPAVVR